MELFIGVDLGASGTVFISSEKFSVDSNNALHAFAHADGGYHLMGCMLSAASCNKWLMDEIYQTKDYAAEQQPITEDKLGENHVYFLPYLMGERSPINDTNARGTFIGMTMDTTRADLTQAVLEGVAYAIRDSVEVARSLGIEIHSSKICGGAKSALWKKIMANVLNAKLECLESAEEPSLSHGEPLGVIERYRQPAPFGAGCLCCKLEFVVPMGNHIVGAIHESPAN